MASHWPDRIVEMMRGRSVLDVALDLVGGVKGSNDLSLSECANALTVLEWYIEKWERSDCQFDMAVLELITQAQRIGSDWFASQASDMGI